MTDIVDSAARLEALLGPQGRDPLDRLAYQKALPGQLRELDIGAVDIRRRGLAGDVDRLRRQLKLSGSRRATLVMTRVADRPWGLICSDIDLGVAAP